MKKELIIEIDGKAGTVSVETTGFQGKSCAAIHDGFDAMGKVTKEVLKPEYHKNQNNGNTVKSGR